MAKEMNYRLFLDIVGAKVRSDFMPKLGMVAPEVPLEFDLDGGEIAQYMGSIAAFVDAVTFHDKATREPQRVIINFGALGAAQMKRDPHYFAGVYAHELIHVAMPAPGPHVDNHLHPDFLRAMEVMGLEGDPHASKPGPAFKAWVDANVIPEYERQMAQQEAA